MAKLDSWPSETLPTEDDQAEAADDQAPEAAGLTLAERSAAAAALTDGGYLQCCDVPHLGELELRYLKASAFQAIIETFSGTDDIYFALIAAMLVDERRCLMFSQDPRQWQLMRDWPAATMDALIDILRAKVLSALSVQDMVKN